MATKLVELIGRENLWIVLSEVAAYLGISTRSIVLIDLWRVGVWVHRRHQLATIVSYRRLNCWIPVIRQAIANCQELNHLAQLRSVLEEEFNKCAEVYTSEVIEELQELIQTRQAQLEAEKAPRWKAEILMHGNLTMIQRCQTQAELDWLWEEMLKQDFYLRRYPNIRQELEQAMEQRSQYLQQKGSA
ncbi:MAG: hypothetical protein N3E45_13680 [Oscillatoriaceae bacterium SKW80]|nr:hypothetical protein [Oscillatoriaceae bacterium SKYG93]MCX8121851.1 hypothetical protein [Oscillatoriaceae bacterium SKW80]MDW8454612.1 hypothetical protein [Oscillatoriaceae cyanobacterium SKYGB_i_bin93]HIK27422.1 hypothetical protein [Oscillatoriaceae cyanobacterium M7585_C2015_266]